jgi:hypothetical protein
MATKISNSTNPLSGFAHGHQPFSAGRFQKISSSAKAQAPGSAISNGI